MLDTVVKHDFSRSVQSGPETSLDGMMAEVRRLLPTFRARAEMSEENRTIPSESAQELLDIGLARILTPKRFGGMQLGLQAWVDVAVELGKGDAATSWCASLMMHHPHYIAQFPEAAQADVWAGGPDVWIAGTLTPTSKIEQVKGGYRIISCSIPYVSGINHASWSMTGAMLPEPGGAPDWTIFLVPPGKYEIVDTWHTAGMRGTGSNTLVVENLFVPTEHTLRIADMREATTPGREINDGPIYRAPWVTYIGLTFLAPMLGAALGALEDYRSWTAERMSLFGSKVADYTSIQVHLARAAANLDAAELLMRRCVELTEMAEPASLALRARAYRDQARSAELIVDAIDMVMKISGAAGFASSSPIQRAWRDIHFAASHVSLNPEVSFTAWGRQQFGLERDPKQVMY